MQMPAAHNQTNPPAAMPMPNPNMGMNGDERWQFNNGESPQGAPLDDFGFNANMGMPVNNMPGNFTWEMIGLGLEEPLPPQETIDELHQIYFEKVHPSMPMIHRYRYLAAMNLYVTLFPNLGPSFATQSRTYSRCFEKILRVEVAYISYRAPSARPPVCLRYAMWTLACSISDKYTDLKDLFYQRARKYVEADYMKGFGEHMISVAHCQTHILLASYEMKMMYFPRAWINTGSAVRLAQM
jgi:hypothetical protein